MVARKKRLTQIDPALLLLAAECLRCIAHPVRLQLIDILLQGEYTVDELAGLCELSQPATSGHLRLMQGKGLLASERRGRSVYYRVAQPQLASILDCIKTHLPESSARPRKRKRAR